jgi:acyl transferase domain-containing protein/acyl carrier protein
VSSFGVSGTNAHVILEEPPHAEPTPNREPPSGEPTPTREPPAPGGGREGWPPEDSLEALPFLVSAASAAALRAQASRIARWLRKTPGLEHREVAAALALRRAELAHRAVVVAEHPAGLGSSLEALARGEPAGDLIEGVARREGKVAFVFSGQGCQWEGMAVDLWDSSAVFAEQMEACSRALAPHLDFSLEDVLRGDGGPSALEQIEVVQPALFATMVSLAALWRSFGVEPAAVVGHSQGEVAAACVAGGLSLTDAARIVALRSGLIARLAERGAMVWVAAPPEQVERLTESLGERVSLAARNGPSSVVLACERGSLAAVIARFTDEGIRAQEVPATVPSHSAHVEVLCEELSSRLSSIAPSSSRIPFYSTVTGGRLDTGELDGEYWYRNLRQTVRFEEAARELLGAGCNAFIEVGPHPVLRGALEETIEATTEDRAEVLAIGSLRRAEGGMGRFLRSVGEAHVHGVKVDFAKLFAGAGAVNVELPTYAFQRRRYWLTPRVGRGGDPGEADGGDLGLFEVRWGEPPVGSVADSRPYVALLGEDRILDGDGDGLLGGGGVEAKVFRNLETLGVAVAGGSRAPDVLLLPAGALAEPAAEEPAGDLPGAVCGLTERVLGLLRAFLAAEWLEESRLVLVTEGAVSTRDGEAPNLLHAALPGLVRSAHSEHPERFCSIDIDGGDGFRQALEVALAGGERELAVREGRVLVPRVGRLEPGAVLGAGPRGFPEGTVLVTGATGGLGALLARHLAGERGVRRLLLASRRGPEADGAGELRGELEEIGCEVRIAACDVCDRGQLEELLASIPREWPLRAVVHAAGVLDDGVVSSLGGERLRRVLAPKVDAAIHLHELTREIEGCELIFYSSAAGTIGGPGQANYAAANAFLDALAAHRHANGLRATSLAWGAWASPTNLLNGLDGSGLEHYLEQIRARLGLLPFAPADGLALFDAARAAERPLLLPWRIDMAALRARADAGVLPVLLSSLVHAPARGAEGSGESLRAKLESAAEPERQAIVLELVARHAAAVLGHASPDAIDPGRAFRGLGLDSLGAVELRNRLERATGLRLPATLVFSYPTPLALASYLRAQATGAAPAPSPPVEQELDRVERALEAERIEAATPEELFELAERQWAAAEDGGRGGAASEVRDV